MADQPGLILAIDQGITNPKVPLVQPWREHEITLTAEGDYPSPYTDVDVWAEFTNENGTTLRRPAFWDGGCT